MKIQSINQSLAIILPKSICIAYNWKKGDSLSYKIEKHGELVLFKKS